MTYSEIFTLSDDLVIPAKSSTGVVLATIECAVTANLFPQNKYKHVSTLIKGRGRSVHENDIFFVKKNGLY